MNLKSARSLEPALLALSVTVGGVGLGGSAALASPKASASTKAGSACPKA